MTKVPRMLVGTSTWPRRWSSVSMSSIIFSMVRDGMGRLAQALRTPGHQLLAVELFAAVVVLGGRPKAVVWMRS